MRFLILFLSIFFLIHLHSSAQGSKKISGIVRGLPSQESLIGATVRVVQLPKIATTTNEFGFFSLSVPAVDSLTIEISYLGYRDQLLPLAQFSKEGNTFFLTTAESDLEEVIVASQKKVPERSIGVEKLSPKDINAIPVLFGERDILKTLQLLPGIKSAGDGNSGFYVRGGGADQNLILLDDAPVYNAAHLLGFFSTFNSDAIKDVTVYKGNMPASYGGRLSSVLDVRTNDGNASETKVSGGIGLIASHLNIEGPIVKNKISYIFNARRTYVDAFLKMAKDSSINQNILNFYDLNGKVNYRIDDKNNVFLSIYKGRDNLGFGSDFGLNWGNTSVSLRWNHIYSNALFSNTALIFSDYNYNVKINIGTNNLKINSAIKDYVLRHGFQWQIDNQNKLDFGIMVTRHNIRPGQITASETSSFNSQILETKHSLESAIWVSHDWKISRKWQLTEGVRASLFSVLGPGTFYSYDSSGDVSDSAIYGKGKTVKKYVNIEPRISLKYNVNSHSGIQFNVSRNVQNLHLLSNSTSANPTDLWIPSSNNVKPEISDQVAIGYFANSNNQNYTYSSELYYKWMQRQIDYKNGAELIANQDVESQLLFGKGRAYGWENYFKKNTGRLTGWISYTLSRTERKIPQINNETWYPARQDRTHEVSVVGIYKLSPKWTLSGTWIYYTGNAVTFPSGKYLVQGVITNLYTERNGYRMPAYHRLDLGATLLVKKTKNTESSWSFSLYNAYGRENAYSFTFKTDPGNPDQTQVERISLFKFIPSVSYNFKF